jgi:hypothetical protein
MGDEVEQAGGRPDYSEWWECALGGAAAKRVFDNDPRPVEIIANEIMNDFLDTVSWMMETRGGS